MYMYRCPYWPEKGTASLRAIVTGDCELPKMVLGVKFWSSKRAVHAHHHGITSVALMLQSSSVLLHNITEVHSDDYMESLLAITSWFSISSLDSRPKRMLVSFFSGTRGKSHCCVWIRFVPKETSDGCFVSMWLEVMRPSRGGTSWRVIRVVEHHSDECCLEGSS